ncbi:MULTISPECIES: hypothetical protein [Ochrobactrum]|jgi:hypothetical protein|uniref:Uncharacterized protein n=1 Tax=Ochrobactrum quorumnocens TaxID=271865 RepID=A0A5N1JZE2_9HYPH|nr:MULTISPECIES: hypothetical protein [Brucella/Ochrobactrum group]KAA9368609.1 hypothetical protein F3W84_09675 [[Ochrobactrum] quorumnocens]MBD7989768.1 hypothetical protein [Ochrobactrum gallinarum]MCV9908736.1 hypothetical protein [Brucella sp. HL-2]MDH7791108.1 hypothetical protein [Ochrobactrum sp. AN78]
MESLIEKAVDDVPWPMAEPSRGILLSRLSLSGSTSDLGPPWRRTKLPCLIKHRILPGYPDLRGTFFLQLTEALTRNLTITVMNWTARVN